MECDACKKRGEVGEGDVPVCAFAKGKEWSAENWNCATTGLLRRMFDGADTGMLPNGVAYHWSNDQNTGIVCAQGVESEDRPLSLWITWYKSRGRTDQVWLMFDDKPPRRPTEEEILALAKCYSPNLSPV